MIKFNHCKASPERLTAFSTLIIYQPFNQNCKCLTFSKRENDTLCETEREYDYTLYMFDHHLPPLSTQDTSWLDIFPVAGEP